MYVNVDDYAQELDMWYFRYFLNLNSIFEPELWDGCHDLMMKLMSFKEVAVVNKKDYRKHAVGMSKDKNENWLKNEYMFFWQKRKTQSKIIFFLSILNLSPQIKI